MKKSLKKSNYRSKKLKKTAKRLAAYSAAAAVTAVTTQDHSANAANVRWDIPDVSVGTAPGLLFNMVTGMATMATATSSNSTPGSMRLIGYFGSNFPGAYIYTPAGSTQGAFVGSGSYAALLAYRDVIDSNDSFGFASDPAYNFGNYANLYYWPDGATGFVGIQFDLGGSLHYGWAEITRDTTALTATLHSFGYNNTPGEGAVAGVPEPSSMMLLAAGAAGLATWRRKRAA